MIVVDNSDDTKEWLLGLFPSRHWFFCWNYSSELILHVFRCGLCFDCLLVLDFLFCVWHEVSATRLEMSRWELIAQLGRRPALRVLNKTPVKASGSSLVLAALTDRTTRAPAARVLASLHLAGLSPRHATPRHLLLLSIGISPLRVVGHLTTAKSGKIE
jgi:hypothetical protein